MPLYQILTMTNTKGLVPEAKPKTPLDRLMSLLSWLGFLLFVAGLTCAFLILR